MRQFIQLERAAQAGVYSDLIATSAHLDITWHGIRSRPTTAVIEQRKRFYARAIPEHWLVFFTHQ